MPRILAILLVSLLVLGLGPLPAYAGWLDEVGFTALQQRVSTLPDGSNLKLLQVEADFLTAGAYMPNVAAAQFASIAFTDITNYPGTASWHATNVGNTFYGRTTSMLTGAAEVGVYRNLDYLSSSLRNNSPSLLPGYIGSYDVMNHSWIMLGGSASANAGTAARLDYQIRTSRTVSVVGVNNVEGSGSTWSGFDIPPVFGQSFNSIAVGTSNGFSSHGPAATGIAKPDLIAPLDKTSWAAGAVSSAAALLRANGKERGVSDLSDPRLIKAQLMAGAVKLGPREDVVVSSDGTTATLPAWQKGDGSGDGSYPLDYYQGAGQLNINHSWDIMAAGPQPAGGVGLPTGWALDTVGAGGTQVYYFDVHQHADSFSAILTWYADASRVGQTWVATVENLDLRFREVQAGSLVLGDVLQASLSAIDNVEHIWLEGLAPGRYAMEVLGGQAATQYALAWQSLGAMLAGDINGDGVVNTDDLGILLANWGGTGLFRPQGDLNGDGLVNTDDLGILLSQWGAGTAGTVVSADGILAEWSAIPEPGTLALLGLGTLGLRSRRRRTT